MSGKTVTLSPYVAGRLEEFKTLNDRFEELFSNRYGELIRTESDSDLIMYALSNAIEEMKKHIAFLEEEEANHKRTEDNQAQSK